MPRGGYQKPRNPAPVSGPGAMSKRTDGGPAQKLRDLPDARYGENATYRELQQAAPLAQTPPPGGSLTTSPGGGDLPEPVGFDAPTSYPDRPVTTGIAMGPGAGPEALGLPSTDKRDIDRVRSLLPALEVMASLPTTSPETRNFIRYLRGIS